MKLNGTFPAMSFIAHSCEPCAAPAALQESAQSMMLIWAIGLFVLRTASSFVAQPLACRDPPIQPIQVFKATDAAALIAIAVCPSAQLTVVWHGTVVLSALIVVADSTTLQISAGSTEAVIDSKNATHLFEVQGV
jgi:hypothetical protein